MSPTVERAWPRLPKQTANDPKTVVWGAEGALGASGAAKAPAVVVASAANGGGWELGANRCREGMGRTASRSGSAVNNGIGAATALEPQVPQSGNGGKTSFGFIFSKISRT